MVEEKGLSAAVADRIGQFVLFRGEPKELWAKLSEAHVFGDHALAAAAMSDLNTLFKYLDAMGTLQHVSFDLSLARGLDYYTGVIYEAVLTEGTSQVSLPITCVYRLYTVMIVCTYLGGIDRCGRKI